MITLADVKRFLTVIHDYDDEKLSLILEGAINEALNYCNLDSLDDITVDGVVPRDFQMGVMLLCQGDYNLGVNSLPALRKAAETKLHPYRKGIGV